MKDDEVFSGENGAYLSQVYQQYLSNPTLVDPKWQRLFRDCELAPGNFSPKIILESKAMQENPEPEKPNQVCVEKEKKAEKNAERAYLQKTIGSLRLLQMIRSYRVRGHLHATLDPLGLQVQEYHAELDSNTYGFDEYDETAYLVDNMLGFTSATFQQVLEKLQKVYCGNIGYEYMHIQDPDQRAWIQEKIENDNLDQNIDKKSIYKNLAKAEMFENFLHKRFPGAKRFGLDGGEATIAAIHQIMESCVNDGVDEIVIGMSHRGRLNVMANIVGQPLHHIFAMFQGESIVPENFDGSGDVKYHLGYSSDKTLNDKPLHISLTPNPSHLEFVGPVVQGKVRSKQDLKQDVLRKRVIGLVLHGDAAFNGQGITTESIGLDGLEGYDTGGTLHIIINNQIGFTTTPRKAHSSPYCTDVAKGIQAPIFHVNGDYPDEVVKVAKLATEFTRQFHKDCFIDLVCYRRHGHNEGDEPMFTQPMMYKKIAKHLSLLNIYEKQLSETDKISTHELQEIKEAVMSDLENAFKSSKNIQDNEKQVDWLRGSWSSLNDKKNLTKTSVDGKTLKMLAEKLNTFPDSIAVHKKLMRLFDLRKDQVDSGVAIDWANAEMLAYASLVHEGYHVRLSGQDSTRGTFSQRHAAVIDQNTNEYYYPINHLQDDQKVFFEVHDSPLSEAAVLGFEYGYSNANPNTLVLWEAQFGDFANGAQVIIDQFIASAEKKWSRLCGLVMLLPHGSEGQGPEHSSARPERFLQLCAENNMFVVNCTTPANYFHALRRQIHNNWRIPLIVFTPKSLLRHKKVYSHLQDFDEKSKFEPVLLDGGEGKLDQVILCSGKVYYDLLAKKNQLGLKIPIIRLEQLYPFPKEELRKVLGPFVLAKVIWCQEEPQNMGAWYYIDRLIEQTLKELAFENTRPIYVGRRASASPATGYAKRHEQEQVNLVNEALGITTQD